MIFLARTRIFDIVCYLKKDYKCINVSLSILRTVNQGNPDNTKHQLFN